MLVVSQYYVAIITKSMTVIVVPILIDIVTVVSTIGMIVAVSANAKVRFAVAGSTRVAESIEPRVTRHGILLSVESPRVESVRKIRNI